MLLSEELTDASLIGYTLTCFSRVAWIVSHRLILLANNKKDSKDNSEQGRTTADLDIEALF